MYFKTSKIINILIILPLIYLLTLEIIIRIIIFLFTLNSGILVYGINKNINLNLHSIKKKEFYISNNYKVFNKLDEKKIKNKNQIWIFGGSTSNKGFCDSKKLSWVDFLEVNLQKKNYSKNGINSSFSINLLKYELQKKESPKIIIWANKVNEILHSKRASDNKNKFYYFVNSFKLSLKQNLVIFYFFDEILLRLFDKININIRNEKTILSKDDYLISSENFFKNTKTAIELAKLYKVEKFYIVSIFNQSNLKNSDTDFFNYYIEKVNKLIKVESFVNFINTKEYLKTEDKKMELFCDTMHHNYKGKVITAKIISNYINDL
tara:strand:+ start:657 stop:1619 length:963 start_codon:yes stop_codon:yes gene_type:complete